MAVEFDPQAFVIARKNLRVYGSRVVPHKGALWPREEMIVLGGAGMGTKVVGEAGEIGATVQGFTAPQIMAEQAFRRIDVFKCDIEDAEASLFSEGDVSWLRLTNNILIELHSSRPGEIVTTACTRAGLRYREIYRLTHRFIRE